LRHSTWEGGIRIVLLAPSLDDQLIGPAAAERARQRLGRPLNRVSVHVGELLGVKWTHGEAPDDGCGIDAVADSAVLRVPRLGRYLPAPLPGRTVPSDAAEGGLRMMLVAMLTTAARSDSSPGITSVVLSLASLPN
jgi:hypothetical protein